MVSVLIKHAGFHGGGESCVCMCEINNLLHHGPSWGFKDEIDYITIVTAIPSITYTLSLQCKGNRLFLSYDVCVSVCLWSDRLTVHAQSQREGVRQAGRQQLYWDFPLGPKVSCLSFPLPRLSASLGSSPQRLCVDRRDFHPHTHASFIADQFNTHQQAIDGCLSVRRNIQ